MKTIKRFLFTLITVCMLHSGVSAQSLNCNEFLITGVTSVNGIIYVDVAYNGSTFINYPYVALITDLSGDTLSTGVMNFFGQNAGTTQTYETNTVASTVPSFLDGTIVFVANNDTCFISYSGPVETATCADFCVNSVTPGFGNVWVEVYYGGNDFINYPHVMYLIDTNNDTLAYGNMGFFGQFGNSVLVHEAFLLTGNFPANFTGTVEFMFNSVQCQLPFPCASTSLQESGDEFGVEVFPNPASGYFQLKKPEGDEVVSVEMTDINGKMVRNWSNPGSDYLDIADLSAGLYILKITTSKGNSQISKLSVNN